MGVDSIQSLNEMKREAEKKKVIGSKKVVDSDEEEKKKAVDSDEEEKKKAVDSDEEEKKKVIESEKESESDSESSDSEDEDMKSSHKAGGKDYDWNGFPKFLCPPEVSESEEDLIRDSDRHELDRGLNFVLRKGRTVTNPRRPLRTYLSRSRKGNGSVLYNLGCPLVLLTKMALARYNEIRGTNYEYVGLVKAYKAAVGASEFTVRFKACLKDQPPIDFQTVVLKAIPEKPKPGKKRRKCYVRVKFVYPLPAKSKSTST